MSKINYDCGSLEKLFLKAKNNNCIKSYEKYKELGGGKAVRIKENYSEVELPPMENDLDFFDN